jgi:hypothetical protein
MGYKNIFCLGECKIYLEDQMFNVIFGKKKKRLVELHEMHVQTRWEGEIKSLNFKLGATKQLVFLKG